MSETGKYSSVRVSADGVRVHKRYAADEFPVPAIAFDISSGREESVTLRLSDGVPEGVAVSDLGFHPDYGSEHWTIEEDRITFEREFEPGDSYTTVYGIRTVDDVAQFLSEPVIESVEPPLPEDSDGNGIVLESDDALVENAIAGGTDPADSENENENENGDTDVPSTLDLRTPDGLDGADGSTEADDPPATLDLSTPDGANGAGGANGATDTTGGASVDDSADTTVEPAGEGGLVAALATELRENEVPDEDLALLREVLLGEVGGTTTARLDRLQSDVADLRAYTGALEEFLDENGTGEELIAEFEGQLEEFEKRINQLETDFVAEVQGRIDELGERIDKTDTETADLAGRVDGIENELEALDDIEEQLEALDRLDDVEEDVETLQEWREQLISTIGG